MSVKCNGVTVGDIWFPNNERIIDISAIKFHYPGHYYFSIDFNYETDTDISVLFMLKQWIDDEYGRNLTQVELNIPYMPYSRMDRRIEGYGFTLKYLCNLINYLAFSKVIVFDPHSDVCVGMLDRCQPHFPSYEVQEAVNDFKAGVILYPDNGAYKKYNEHLDIKNVAQIFGFKHRDLYTGQITQYAIPDVEVVKNRKVLIVDDICVKGGTAYHAGKALREAGAKDVALYISHCEYAIQDGELLKSDIISTIYTTHSILQDQLHSKIKFV